MIAARVTESYTSLFLTPNDNDGSRNARIAMIGAFEVRLLEILTAINADMKIPSIEFNPKVQSFWCIIDWSPAHVRFVPIAVSRAT